jgi:hypothetical protein
LTTIPSLISFHPIVSKNFRFPISMPDAVLLRRAQAGQLFWMLLAFQAILATYKDINVL